MSLLKPWTLQAGKGSSTPTLKMEAVHLFPEPELGTEIDYGFMQQYRQVSCLPDFTSQSMEVAPNDELHPSFNLESFSSYPTFHTEKRPNKHPKTDHNNQSPKTSLSPHLSQILSFGAPGGDPDHLLIYGKTKEEAEYPDVKAHAYQRNKRPCSSRTKGNSLEDHVMAERKRREKLNQRLITLSAVIPGLKKMEKGTILAEAIKYVKELQERVEVLEEQTKKRSMESAVLVKKSQVSRSAAAISSNSEDSSLSDKASESDEQSTGSLFLEVEVRISDKDVLIRIHCEKQKGTLSNILNQIESLHLTVTNSSVVPFGNSILDITVISQMEKEFSMSVKDLVKHLTQAFSKFI